MRNSETFSAFNKSILRFIKPSPNPIFLCHSINGTKLITILRLCLGHLCKRKFSHNFHDALHPICICGDGIETTIHYLLHFPNCLDERKTLLNNLQNTGENINDTNNSQISEFLLFGVSSNTDTSNTSVLNTTIQYLLATKRFDLPLTS